MKRLLPIILLFAAIFSFNKNSFASHIPGANITYTCDPNDPLTYTFTLTLFRTCPGTHPTTMSSTYFTITNTCGLANPIVPTFNQVGTETDVNQLCASASSNCSGGTNPGVWKYTYEATITLPANCDSWTIMYDLCCRDVSLNMSGGSGNDMNVSTTMNTQTSPCNSSPVVTSIPIPYACASTNFTYCLSAMDPEGDSLVYTMVSPQGIGGAPIAFNAPYTINSPLSNFTLDPQTGCIAFNESTIGQYVVTIQIDSYDSNGNLAGSLIHDFKVIVMSCTNTPPSNPSSGITNFSGTGTQLGSNQIGLCYGDNICFDVVFEDAANPGDNITIQTDGTTVLPGATFVQTGTNPATGTFCWTAQPGYTNSIITFSAEDDGCPVMGTSGFAVDLAIATGVYSGTNPTICGTQTGQLQATGATAFTWSPSTGLSCTNCANPVASPSSTQTYIVTGNLGGTCPNQDTVTVTVVPDFTPTMNPATATICANEIVQLNVSGPGSQAPYTYDWSPSYALNNTTIANPLANPLTSTTYTATITSAAGCVKTATADVIISGIGPTVEVVPSTIDICQGESVPLTTSAMIYPVVCGPSSGCSGTNSTFELGTATTATSTYSPFYGSTTVGAGYDYSNKIQMIFTAAEMNAMGYYGGTIETIALFSHYSYAYVYDNVTVSIGCTTQDEYLSTAFITGGLTQVYSANNVNPANANWHVFNIADWDWDGVSNIVIQICADEDNTGNEGIDYVRYSTTSPAYRFMYYHTTAGAACPMATGSRVTNRPNVQFGMCVESATGATYSWSPSASLNNSSSANPTATPSSTTSYVVDVTANGCTGSGLAQINVSPDYTINPSGTPGSICYGQSTTLNANSTFGGGLTYSWEPSGAFSNPTAASPTVTPTGPTTYYVTTSNGYCTKTDSVLVNVGGVPVSALASADTICMGDPVALSIIAATGNCGVNYADLSGTTTTGTFGTSVSSTTTYGPFYGSTSASTYNNKKQMIFTATELLAMGFTAGTFNSIALNVSTTYGYSYDDFTIWMGCTPQEQYLDANFIPTSSMDQVYYNPYYTVSNGWNTFNITGFDWDGASNIVVQYCASHEDHQGSEYCYYTSTSPAYSIMYYNSTINACANATGTRTYYRPDTRFTMVNSNLSGGTTYSWTPAALLSNPTSPTPTATSYTTTDYTVTVTDPLSPGCPSTATVQVAVDPSNSVTASQDTIVCPGDPAQLNAVFTGPVPTTVPCGPNPTGCVGGPSSTATVGTAYSYTTTYSPFYGSYYDTHLQFLYTAAELTAMGFQSGTITELGFNIPYKYSTGAFSDFTIGIGCTNETSLSVATGWLPTTTVWGPSNYTTSVGINTFVLSTAFDWDGVSNIVIETCFNNNAAVSYDYAYYSLTTGYNTTMRNYSSVSGSTNGCTLAPAYVYAAHPDVTFTICAPPPASPSYSWSPAATLNNSTILNPIATPSTATSYVITVTGGVCTVFDTVNVGVCNPLPVELLNFDGYNNGDVNELMWSTLTEVDNDYFLVERSLDGINFYEIGNVDGAGNSTHKEDYRLIDQAPIEGVNYYRLKQVDFNGNHRYSETIAINTDRGAGIQIYPNPTTNDLYVDFSLIDEENDYTIFVTDVSGKTISQQVETGMFEKTFKIEGFGEFSTGIYMIKIVDQNNELVKVAKVTKQ